MRSPCSTRPLAARREEGIAMIVTLMVLMLVSALMVGLLRPSWRTSVQAGSTAIRRKLTRPRTRGWSS